MTWRAKVVVNHGCTSTTTIHISVLVAINGWSRHAMIRFVVIARTDRNFHWKFKNLWHNYFMTTVKEIERAIESLPKSDIAALSTWFEKFESEMWDDQIENDATNGRFDDIFAEVVAEHASGRTREL